MLKRTMRGKMIDMAKLAAENATQVAVGNASMNARGDIVGPGGAVMKPREQIAREYHANNPKAVRQVALRDIEREVFVSPQEAVATARENEPAKAKKRKLVD